jgi:murein L,D-transpeptidase YcbB/YkuD
LIPLAGILVLLMLAACDRQPPPPARPGTALASGESEPPPEAVATPTIDLDQVADVIRAGIASGRAALLDRPGLGAGRDELIRLYDPEAYGPLWLDATGRPSSAAQPAIAALRSAPDDGLDPLDYSGGRLDSVATGLTAAGARPEPESLGRFDLALSAAFLRYLHHLHNGRIDPRAVRFKLPVGVDRHDFVALARNALADGAIPRLVASQPPALVQYQRVKEALAHYRLLADSVTDSIPSVTTPVEPDAEWQGAPPLARRLRLLGDLPDSLIRDDSTHHEVSLRYQEPLVTAVKRFQTRHGLEPDGIIGPATVAALNVPIARRAQQLALTLERLRWLPDLTGGRFIVVNIPSFHLWGWDSLNAAGAPSIDMNVIVGRNALDTQTPIFDEQLEYLIFRPYWNVPSSILRNEILPAIKKDSTYLTRNNMEIVQGAGDDARPVAPTAETVSRLTRGTLRVRQRPGSENSLGLVKFMFPNAANVYLHGTPAEELFGRSRRDFSHGCVRVERPIDLAVWALRDVPAWDQERIVAAMEKGKPTRVNLPRPMPVILFYTTAIVELDGRPGFYPDLYGHDQRLLGALGARP